LDAVEAEDVAVATVVEVDVAVEEDVVVDAMKTFGSQ
jgi:hypothetical protein